MGNKTYKEIMKFSIVGLINTGVDFVLFAILLFLGFPVLVSQAISYCCGVGNSYWLNRTWTFQNKKSSHHSEAMKFIIVNVFTLLLTSILLILLVEHLQMSILVAKGGCIVIGMGVNFLSSKFWVFQGVAGKSFE